MARGKYLNFKEAREQGRMDEFARQHEIPPGDQHPRAQERFTKTVTKIVHLSDLKTMEQDNG